jgi:hypothetical protein
MASIIEFDQNELVRGLHTYPYKSGADTVTKD